MAASSAQFSSDPSPEAFFISPEGQYVPVPHLHISAICADPEIFGLTHAILEPLFKEHHEEWASEGFAREEIILGLLTQNWVRVRLRSERGKGPVCMFQVHALNHTTKTLISAFSAALVSDGILGTKAAAHTTASVKFSDGSERTSGWITLKDLPSAIEDGTIR